MRRYILLLIAIFAVMGLVSSASTSQSGALWKLEYFNNPYLMGPSPSVQYAERVALDWGAAGPAANIGADRFSARISSDIHFAPGTYRFYLLSDDRAHLYVDFQSIINNWDGNQVGVVLSQDVTIAGGTIHIQIDFREEEGNAYIFFDWENIADGIQGPNFAVSASGVGQAWTAEYFNNTALSGSPAVIRQDNGPVYSWGFGAPTAGITADNFSVRWTASLAFDGNPYLLSVTSDDGVRVYIDNVLYIDRWSVASGTPHTATATPAAGKRQVRVEFFEVGGIASINFSMTRQTTGQPVSSAAYLVVATGRLNVRNLPTVSGSTVLTKIDFGATYPIIGVNSSRTWWQINVNGVIGWVSAPYVTSYNTTNVPVTDGSAPVNLPVTAYRVTTIANLNMRSGPSVSASRIGVIPIFNTASVIGRNAASTWWYVDYQGLRGWVSASYAPIQAGVNILTIPILG